MKSTHIFPVIILLLVFSCNNNSKEALESEKKQPDVQNESNSSVMLTEMEENEAGILTGSLQEKDVWEKVSCSGVIEVTPNYIVTVIPPVKGYIKEFFYETGDYIKKGEKLARLSHPEFLKIQEEYLAVKSQAEYFKKEYERQGELAVERAASLKKMQKAKANYLESNARLQSLTQKLDMMNFDPDQVKEGKLLSDMYLYAPINGYVTEMNLNVGELADSNNPVYEIMNMNHLRLRLNVPEKEVAKVSVSQEVTYSLISNHGGDYKAKIADIGSKVDSEELTFPVYADIQNPEEQFKHGLSIKADILVSKQQQHVLPNKAIVEIEGLPHVFIKDEGNYKPFEIQVGKRGEDYTVIKNHNKLDSEKIIIEGASYLKNKFI